MFYNKQIILPHNGMTPSGNETHLFVMPLSAVYVGVKYRPNTDAVRPQPKGAQVVTKPENWIYCTL